MAGVQVIWRCIWQNKVTSGARAAPLLPHRFMQGKIVCRKNKTNTRTLRPGCFWPQPVRVCPVCVAPLCGDGAPQRDRHDGATLCGPRQLYGGTGQRCVPTGGGKYGAVYRSMRSAAAGAQSGTGFGATGERLKNTSWAEVCRTTFLLPMALPVASLALLWKVIVCPKRPCERNFWHPLWALWAWMLRSGCWSVLICGKASAMTASLWSSGLDSVSTDLYRPLPWMVPVGGNG